MTGRVSACCIRKHYQRVCTMWGLCHLWTSQFGNGYEQNKTRTGCRLCWAAKPVHSQINAPWRNCVRPIFSFGNGQNCVCAARCMFKQFICHEQNSIEQKNKCKELMNIKYNYKIVLSSILKCSCREPWPDTDITDVHMKKQQRVERWKKNAVSIQL